MNAKRVMHVFMVLAWLRTPVYVLSCITGAAANSPVEAAAQLATAVRSLRQGPVESAHRTYTGLVARAAQLDQEAKAQKVCRRI